MDVLKYNSLHLLVCFLEKDLSHTLAVRAYSSLWAQWITHGGAQRPISSARDQTAVVYVQGKCLIHYNPCGPMGTHWNARRVFIKWLMNQEAGRNLAGRKDSLLLSHWKPLKEEKRGNDSVWVSHSGTVASTTVSLIPPTLIVVVTDDVVMAEDGIHSWLQFALWSSLQGLHIGVVMHSHLTEVLAQLCTPLACIVFPRAWTPTAVLTHIPVVVPFSAAWSLLQFLMGMALPGWCLPISFSNRVHYEQVYSL